MLPWASLVERLSADLAKARSNGEGLNSTIIGPKGSGKTHIGLTIAEMNRYVLVLATKRSDPLVTALAQKGYHVTGDLDTILWTEREPVNQRVVFWPRPSEKLTSPQRIKVQSAAHAQAMDWADKTGGWSLVIDETMWMQDRLKLQAEMDSLWFQGRTQGLSVIANAQRPSRIPRLAFSQADYLFLAKFTDKRDLETLRDINSNIPRELVEQAIRGLYRSAHQFLWIDTSKDEMAVVVAPPR